MELAISTTKFKLLSVDDDIGFSKNLLSVLVNEFDVSLASNASEALAALKALDFDCVLLDMNLPEIDGLRLLKMLRGLKPTLPVIMKCYLATRAMPDKSDLPFDSKIRFRSSIVSDFGRSIFLAAG